MDKINILHGNVFDKVKELNDNSIDCVVTSPPYWGLRDYGTGTWIGGDKNCPHKRLTKISKDTKTGHAGMFKKGNVVGDAKYKKYCPECGAKRKDEQLGLEETYQEHIKNIVNLFKEIKPKLKESATIWLNYGDSYSSGKRTSTTNQTLRGNKNYGVTRTPVQDGIKEKDLVMIPNRIAIALQDAGWYIRSEIIWHKPNPMPESVRDRPTSAHEKIWLITKSKKYYYDADSIREPLASTSLTRLNQDIKNQKGSTRGNGGMKSNGNMKAVRPYRVLDADQRPEFVETRDLPEHNELREYLSLNRKNKNITIDEIEKHFGNQAGHHWFEKNGSYPSKDDWIKLKKLLNFDDTYDKQLTTINFKSGLKQNHPLGRNKRNVWTITTKPCKEAHFATFPKDLIEPCIKAGCPEGGIVLDPFGGSGTTGIVASQNNRNAILIELNKDYIDIANKRIDKELGLFNK